MKIGVISSSYEALPLFKFLHTSEHEYHLFCDWKYANWSTKSSELFTERCNFGREYLLAQGIDALIVPPAYECMNNGDQEKVLPLFTTYVREYCLKYSIVGKLGLLCEYNALEQSQDYIDQLSTKHTLTDNQNNIKKFHNDFPLWKKDVSSWIDFLGTFGKRDPLVRKAIKHDLRYFKDADVDTLIPLSRGFLQYEKMIQMRANSKRLRLHGLDAVEKCFVDLTADQQTTSYSVMIHATDAGAQQILSHKKRKTLLSRGGKVEVKLGLV